MEFLLTFLAKMTILIEKISKVFTMDQKQFRVYAKKYRIMLCRRWNIQKTLTSLNQILNSRNQIVAMSFI